MGGDVLNFFLENIFSLIIFLIGFVYVWGRIRKEIETHGMQIIKQWEIINNVKEQISELKYQQSGDIKEIKESLSWIKDYIKDIKKNCDNRIACAPK